MEHVKLPLTYGEGSDREWYIHDADGNWIAEAVPADPGVAEEVARRIVACANACAGIPTEMLEAMPSGPAALLPMHARLEAQRDELLDALDAASTSLETIAFRSFGEDSYLKSKPQMRAFAQARANVARAAIASAKGGAA